MKEILILIGIISILNLVCFYIGAVIGQKVTNKEKLTPTFKTPTELIQNHSSQKEYKNQNEKYKIIESNIDSYDGTTKKKKKLGG